MHIPHLSKLAALKSLCLLKASQLATLLEVTQQMTSKLKLRMLLCVFYLSAKSCGGGECGKNNRGLSYVTTIRFPVLLLLLY